MMIIRNDGRQVHTLEDALALVYAARRSVFNADVACVFASEALAKVDKERANAIARLNDAEKIFDASVNDIRADAPEGSDWFMKKDEAKCRVSG